MKHQRILASTIVGLIFAGTPTPSAAGPFVGATSAVTGTAGAWVHDFTIANNLPGMNAVYFFEVKMPTGNALIGSPEGFAAASFQPGMSGSGFQVLDTGTLAAPDIAYFAFGDGYPGPECWRCGETPGVEGIARLETSEGVTAVPEPASWAMLLAGFWLTAAIARRRGLVVTA